MIPWLALADNVCRVGLDRKSLKETGIYMPVGFRLETAFSLKTVTQCQWQPPFFKKYPQKNYSRDIYIFKMVDFNLKQ